MKMVSAAKLRRAQDAIVQMRPYSEKLQDILANLSSSLDASENSYAEVRDQKKVLIIAISSNRGLAGAFNANIVKAVDHWKKSHLGVDIEVLALGKKAGDALKKRYVMVNGTFSSLAADVYENLNFGFVSNIATEAMQRFTSGQYDQVFLVYNSFKNAASQIIKTEQFLPIIPAEPSGEGMSSVDYIFEPSKEEIIKDLIPKSLRVQLYKALLDSHASEHGARMTAMHKATDNAGELLKNLKLTYNKARQAAITGEILEIVAGAEALS